MAQWVRVQTKDEQLIWINLDHIAYLREVTHASFDAVDYTEIYFGEGLSQKVKASAKDIIGS